MNSMRAAREVSQLTRRNPLAIHVVPACAALLWGAWSLPAFAQATVGVAGGVARDSSSGKPLAEVEVIAHNLNQGADHATLTNIDGIFTFTNLEPGPYEFEAIKDGFRKSSMRAEVDGLRAARVELPLQFAVDLPRTAEKSNLAPLTEREKEMLERIERLERRLAAMDAALMSKDANGTQGIGKTPTGNETLVASLKSGAGEFPGALSPETPQTPMPQQSRRQGWPGSNASDACRPRRTQNSGSPASPRRRSGRGQRHALRVRRLHLAQRNPAQQRHCAGYEILHSGNSIRHALHGGFQPADRSHHRRVDRIVPLRRSPDRAGQRRRRFPLAERSRPNPVHGGLVCHHHTAQ